MTPAKRTQYRAIRVSIAAWHVRNPGLDEAEADARAEAIVALNEVREGLGLRLLQGDFYLRMTSHALRQILLATVEAPARKAAA